MKKIIFIKVFILFLYIMILPSYSRESNIKFIVTVPEYTSLGSNVYITGNLSQLGAWDPKKIKLKKTGRYTYEIDIKASEGAIMMFKFTRGSLKTVEKDKDNY